MTPYKKHRRCNYTYSFKLKDHLSSVNLIAVSLLNNKINVFYYMLHACTVLHSCSYSNSLCMDNYQVVCMRIILLSNEVAFCVHDVTK